MAKHECEGRLPHAQCGPAIEYCRTSKFDNEEGMLWAGNGEYESQVAFCPYCGKQAKDKPIIEE